MGIEMIRQPWFVAEDGVQGSSTPGSSTPTTAGLSSGSSTPMTAAEREEMCRITRKLDQMAATAQGPPWGACGHAAEWDSLTALQWFERNVRHAAVLRELILFCQTVYAAEPSDVSFLYFLFYMRSAGGMEQLGDGDGGAQTFRLRGGAQQISTRLADDVEKLGGTIRLGLAVTHLTSVPTACGGGLVEVKAGGPPALLLLHARRVVIALPPPLWRSIAFSPPLPPAKQDIAARMFMGCAVKTVTMYSRAFWEARSAAESSSSSGALRERESLEDTGPVANLFPSFYDGRPGLTGIVTASRAAAFCKLSDEERRAAVLAQYARYFRTAEAVDCVTWFVCKDWMPASEPYTGGCYAAMMPPGLATTSGDEIRTPAAAGRIHFAGSELASQWVGYMEGAVESGERAAQEVCAALRSETLVH